MSTVDREGTAKNVNVRKLKMTTKSLDQNDLSETLIIKLKEFFQWRNPVWLLLFYKSWQQKFKRNEEMGLRK